MIFASNHFFDIWGDVLKSVVQKSLALALAFMVSVLPLSSSAEEGPGEIESVSGSEETSHEVMEENPDLTVKSAESDSIMDTDPDPEIPVMTYEEQRDHYLFLERMALLQVVGLGVIGGSVFALAALRFYHVR